MRCKICGNELTDLNNIKTARGVKDNCKFCQKKYKRLQYLHYTVPMNKLKPNQLIEHNTLVKELSNKTNIPLIVNGEYKYLDKTTQDNVALDNVMQQLEGITTFELYANAIPKKVVFNQDRRFGGASNQQERESYNDEYRRSIQYLFDSFNDIIQGGSAPVFDKDLWIGNLQEYSMMNSDILDMENINEDGTFEGVEPAYMYHWLCFILFTWKATVVKSTELAVDASLYLTYNVDPIAEYKNL